MTPKARLTIIILVLLVLGALSAQFLLEGDAKTISLGSAPPLTGSVSQSINTGGGEIQLPVAGKDYNLKNTHYFENNTWAVTSVLPLKNEFDPAAVVLQKHDGIFQVVAGPGNDFPSSYLKSLPADVGQYLVKLGAVGGTFSTQ